MGGEKRCLKGTHLRNYCHFDTVKTVGSIPGQALNAFWQKSNEERREHLARLITKSAWAGEARHCVSYAATTSLSGSIYSAGK